jgi:hypothetical protein
MLMGAADTGARLGVDLFSVRSQKWTPIESLDYCARLGAKLVHFSEIRFLGRLDDENLRQVQAHAKKLDISVEIGMRSCCPTSKMFDPQLGTADEQLIRMLNAARTIGSDGGRRRITAPFCSIGGLSAVARARSRAFIGTLNPIRTTASPETRTASSVAPVRTVILPRIVVTSIVTSGPAGNDRSKSKLWALAEPAERISSTPARAVKRRAITLPV